MLKKALLIFSILGCCYQCTKNQVFENPIISTIASGDTQKAFIFGGTKNDAIYSVTKTSDGGYATLGYAQSIDGDITTKTVEGFDFWVQKFSSKHELLWSKTYGGAMDDRGAKIIETSDTGLALLGFSRSTDGDLTQNAGNKDFWLIKTDAEGTLQWQKTYGFSGQDYGTSFVETEDNGFLLTGVLDVSASGGQGNARTSNRHAGGDIWAIKVTNNGEVEWSKYYGGSYTDTALDVIATPNNEFIIVGSSDSNDVDISGNLGTYDFWVLKIDSTGQLLWEKSYGGSEIDEASAITTTPDGNFIIVGDTRSSDRNVSINKGAADLWMLKIDTEGAIIWEKSFGGTSFDVAHAVHNTADKGLIIVGSSRSTDGDLTNNQGQNDAWILKTTSEGDLLWQKTIGGTMIDFFYDVIELNPATIIAVGESRSSDGDIFENNGFLDGLVVKIN